MYTCIECGESFERGNVYYVEDTGDYVCENCFNRGYHCCDDCSSTFSPD